MSWLLGYKKRAVFRIKSSSILASLTNFPVNLYLTNNIFDLFEYTGQDYTKIALADSYGNNLYVEVVFWDSTNNKAQIYVKLPYISSSEDTYFYLYYGSNISNSNYIGTTTTTPAKQVWDSNFVAVHHLTDLTNVTAAFSPNTLYTSETSGTASAGSTATANRTFSARSVAGLTKSNGVLKIRLKVNNVSYMDLTSDSQLEISSSTSADTNEWYYSLNSDLAGIVSKISTTYTSIFIPLSYFVTQGGEPNVSSFVRVRWYVKAKTGSLTIYWDDAEIIRTTATNDSTTNNNKGYARGAMDTSNTEYVSLGKGMHFDGTDDRIEVPDSSSLDLVNALTVESYFRIRQDYISDYKNIVTKGADSGNFRLWQLLILNNGTKQFLGCLRKTSSDSDVTAGGNFSWTVGDFYHVAMTYDKSYLKLYKNGTIFGSPTAHSEDIVSSNESLYIGCGWWAGAPADYSMVIVTESRISSVARSEAWVKATSDSLRNTLVVFENTEYVYTPAICNYDDTIYAVSVSGINLYDITGTLTNYIHNTNIISTWANDNYIFAGTTNSGIDRYNKSTLSYIDNYKNQIDLDSNYVCYLHGNNDFLCATTSSGVCRIDLNSNAVVKTTNTNSYKCFQVSNEEFYYVTNNEYPITSWRFCRKIHLGDNLVYTQNTHIIPVSMSFIKNNLLSGISDIVFCDVEGNEFDYEIYLSGGNSIFLIELTADVSDIYILYSKSNITETKTLSSDNYLSIDFSKPYPSKIFREVTTILNNKYSYATHDVDRLRIYLAKGDGSSYVRLRGHYMYGDCFAEMYIIANNAIDTQLVLRNDAGYTMGLRFYVTSSNYFNAQYNTGGGWTTQETLSTTGAPTTKVYVYKIKNTVYLRYDHPPTTIRTWSASTTGFGSNSLYFQIYSEARDNYTSYATDTNITSFKYKADIYYTPTNFEIFDEYKATYSEVYKLVNINHDWDATDAITKFTSEDIINSFYFETPTQSFSSSKINDFFVTEDTSTTEDNTIFLATNFGAAVINETSSNYEDSSFVYYLLDT